MKVGDLVRYKNDGTFGVITKVWNAKFNKIAIAMYEVLWVDGTKSDVLPRRLEVV